MEEETLDVTEISPRTKELALSVTEGLDNDFDRAKAIETYLRQYQYSAETDLREYDDFVDAFLFEEQEGYCIHYASAMVQMLRANEIPARLAQGYCCTYENRERGVKKVTIYGSDAHAWPEAYIRGFGWVRFEPTAVMETAEEYGWNLRVKEVTADADASSETAAGAEKEMLMEVMPKPGVTELEKSEEELQLQEEQERKELIRLLIILPLAALAALLLINMAMKKIRYLRRNGFQRLESNLEDIRWLIRELYPSDWNNRHLLEYAAVLEDPGHREQMEKTVLRYYELRFKGGQLAEEEENRAVSLREALYGEYLRLSGKKYWMQKLRAFFALEGYKMTVTEVRKRTRLNLHTGFYCPAVRQAL